MTSHNNMAYKNYSIGIMQGRLTPSKDRGIQFFPFDNWEQEFHAGKQVGIDEIEFIFDFDRYVENPLWTKEGEDKIRALIAETGVGVRHICADFFMRRPFFRVTEDERKENVEILKKLILAASEIGSVGIEIPLVDNSSIKTQEEEDAFVSSVKECLPLAEEKNIAIGLEIDYPPQKFVALLARFNHPLLKANYDSGNSAGLGYEPHEEITTLGSLLSNVHIKDRKFQGTTVTLGTGSTDFSAFFQGLKETRYKGSFILQVARGADGKEPETIRGQMDFVKGYIDQYLS